ncbi:Lysophospholipase L1 [Thermomonospora echinospora]|uniref:Lysophospholipase L1 n=1 Tax=Thermomonospora echinospora TaxID=1992 RepID=A0A1H5XSK8_9ACTN|nr:GDSL-type esterase/lipase family protein [Thermomonospora echinospora]SEG14236.1 Lysophospholipase L1 [Thermomonospora echinospora]
MARRAPHPAVSAGLAFALALGLSPAAASAAEAAPLALTRPDAGTARPAVPYRMAALGDSITRGYNSCGWFFDCVRRSWATGSYGGIDSHYLRLRARNGALAAHNNAVTGAKVAMLAGQADAAVSQRAEYVTILIGANDACTSTVAGMTSVAAYEARFRAGMQTLRDGLPSARIFVSSIPDLRWLWRAGRDNRAARAAWSRLRVCQSMLTDPISTDIEDVERRRDVRRRVIAYNEVMGRVCAQDARCRFDDGAVFSHPFTLDQVSRWDYFHPNARGQATLARVTYAKSFWSAAALARRRDA